MTFLSRAPPEKTVALEHAAIRSLYYDLPHPPSTHMGPEYQFRTDDGSGNSPFDRNMGKSFTPYSRSCTGTRPLPVENLPDPGLVYDALIRRPAGDFTPHPAGLSGLFFSFAVRQCSVGVELNLTCVYFNFRPPSFTASSGLLVLTGILTRLLPTPILVFFMETIRLNSTRFAMWMVAEKFFLMYSLRHVSVTCLLLSPLS